MKKQDDMFEITYMNYSNSTSWPDKDIWHEHMKDSRFSSYTPKF